MSLSAEWRAAICVTVVAFIVYMRTLCPTIAPGDSGELAVAATTLGIAHPPGYPLWTLLGRAAVLALPGTPAYSLNLFSAVCAALCSGLVAALLTLWTGRVFAACAAALAFAWARAVWVNAVVVEVYSLNLLLSMAALFFAVLARRGRPTLFALSAYTLGLGASNHPFALLVGPLVLGLALGPGRTPAETFDVRLRRLMPMAGLFLLGLTVYFYLPARWMAGPEMNWGGIRNLGEIGDHILRSQYGGLGEAAAKTSFPLRLRVFAMVLSKSLPSLVFFLGAFGLFATFRQGHPKRGLLLLAFFVLTGPFTAAAIRYEDTFLDHSVVSVYFLGAILSAMLLAGVGLAELENVVRRRFAPLGNAAAIFGIAIAASLPAFFAFRHARACDRSRSTLARDYAHAALSPLPEGARFYGMGDNECFIIYYFTEIEGLRPDVIVMDRTLNLVPERYGADFAALPRPERKAAFIAREAELAFAEKDRAIFYSDSPDVDGFAGCRVEPNGVVAQLLRPGETAAQLGHRPVSIPPTDPQDYLETHLVSSMLYHEGAGFVREGRIEEAKASFAKAGETAGAIAAVHRNVGVSYLELGEMESAERAFLAALASEPENEDAIYNLATLYASTGRVEESIGEFGKLAARGSEFAEVHLNYGIQLVRAGRLEEALAAAKQALTLEPELGPAQDLENAAREGLALGGEAGILEAQRKMDPLTVGGTLQLAQRYLDRGEITRAMELYQEALKRAPDDIAAIYGLGYGLLKVGRLNEAARAFATILEKDEKSASGRNALAYIYAEQGENLAQAERLVTEAISLEPALGGYWKDTLGWVQFRQGHFPQALETLQLAQSALPLDDAAMRAENNYHLATVMTVLGKSSEAAEAMAAALPQAKGERWEADADALAKKLGVASVTSGSPQ